MSVFFLSLLISLQHSEQSSLCQLIPQSSKVWKIQDVLSRYVRSNLSREFSLSDKNSPVSDKDVLGGYQGAQAHEQQLNA